MSKTTNLNNTVDTLLDIERQIEALEEQRDNLRQALVARIGVGNTFDHPEARVTITQSTTRVMDYETFVATARPGLVRQLTKRVLDTAKFGAMLKADMLPQEVLAIVQTKESAPYPRITLKS